MYLGLAGFVLGRLGLAGGHDVGGGTRHARRNGTAFWKIPRSGCRRGCVSLLWVLCLNGAVLGMEGIVQRASGSSKLLFLVQPLVNPEGVTSLVLMPIARTRRSISICSGRCASASGGRCSAAAVRAAKRITGFCCARPSWRRARSFPRAAAARWCRREF